MTPDGRYWIVGHWSEVALIGCNDCGGHAFFNWDEANKEWNDAVRAVAEHEAEHHGGTP